MASIDKEIDVELPSVVRLFKDGTIERLIEFPRIPPTPHGHATTGVLSKDVTVSPEFSVRIYLPPTENKKIPILVYYHGGGFCFDSSSSILHDTYVSQMVAASKVVCVSVEYRLAPEHPIPTCYEDCWNATQWVASHNLVNTTIEKDPWVMDYADFDKFFIGGDSAGSNIVHHLLLRAANEELNGGLKICGAIMGHPYLWGSKVMGSEASKTGDREKCFPTVCWKIANRSGDMDSPLINPVGAENPACLADLACPRILLNVAEEDEMRDRGVEYYNAVKNSGWKGEIEIFEDVGVGHYFHMLNPDWEKTKAMVQRAAKFINNGSTGSLSSI